MRIGIDIRSLQNDSRKRGIGTYSRCLIKNILSIDRENKYVFFVFGNKPIPFLLREEVFKNVEIKRVIAERKRFVWLSSQAIFPYIFAKEKLDIFHSLEYIVPVFSRTKKLITVYDFINSDYSIYKKRNGLIRRIYFYLKDETLRYADKIIVISEYTKKKIMELVKVKESKIKTIHLAADEVFKPHNDNGLFLELRKKYNINRDFLLYVGAIDHHKNIHTLIKAFSCIRFKNIDLILVNVANNNSEYFMFVNKLIEELKFKNRVHILGYIPQEDLVSLYNMASIVISVSVYEGFGLPILEAMSCGTPVIASGNTSMREIVDSSGILVDPYDTEEIVAAIEKLISDEGLRKTFSQKGLERAKMFSWEKTAKETLSLYEELFD